MPPRSTSKVFSEIFFREVRDFMDTLGGDTPENRNKLIEATIEYLKATGNDQAFNKNRFSENAVPDPHYAYRTERCRDRLDDIMAGRANSMNEPNRNAFRGGMNLFLRNAVLAGAVKKPIYLLPDPVEPEPVVTLEPVSTVIEDEAEVAPVEAPTTRQVWNEVEILSLLELIEDALSQADISHAAKHKLLARFSKVFNI